MGTHPLLWDEFNPNLYTMHIKLLQGGRSIEGQSTGFGMRNFLRPVRSLLLMAVLLFFVAHSNVPSFQETGYPPTDTASWTRIFKICRSYGLNHIRFHSWCPPEAAFDAADSAGFICKLNVNHGQTRAQPLGMVPHLILLFIMKVNAL